MAKLANLWWVACLLLAAGVADAQVKGKIGGDCKVDDDCSDHVYCNGAEVCTSHGCERGTPPCGAAARCDESGPRCVVSRTDVDMDGHANAMTGGDDCNDNDALEFPGNAETWDAADHDEDCDLTTHGLPVDAGGRRLFGREGRAGPVQVCSGEGVVILDGVVGGQEWFRQESCQYGRVCVPQPSGDGQCEARPEGYAAPAVLAGIPLADQPRPEPPVGGQAAAAPPRPKVSGPLAAMPPRPMLPAATDRPVAPKSGSMPTVKSALACPAGQAFSVAVGRCIPIPP